MINLSARRRLGTTPLSLGPLGLGVAPLGNLYAQVSESDALETLRVAHQHGIGWFDVAPYYGFGLAEERLGRFLRETASASAPIVSTKVGRLLEPAAVAPDHEHFVAPLSYRPVFDYTRAGVERSYADSLRRLGLERVQVLLLHDIDRLHHVGSHRALIRQLLDETLPALNQMKAHGRLDAIGLGICEWDVGFEILANADIDCVLLAGRYTLLDHSAYSSGFLDACARRRVSVLAAGVLNSGFLAGGSSYDYRQADEFLLRRRQELATICDRYHVVLPAVALQFAAAHPAVISAVIGARSPQEVGEMLEWHRAEIPAGVWLELREKKFIPEEAPTP